MSIMLRDKITHRVALDAMLCGFAMLLSYLEALLPLTVIPLPGFRLGLANIAVVVVFVLISPMDAALVSFTRIFLMGVLFSSPTSLFFSAMGGACSFSVLFLLKYVGRRCSFLGVSVLCAAAHNTGQILAAAILFGPALIHSYLPLLLFASAFYGAVVGCLLNLLVPRLARVTSRLLRKGEAV